MNVCVCQKVCLQFVTVNSFAILSMFFLLRTSCRRNVCFYSHRCIKMRKSIEKTLTETLNENIGMKIMSKIREKKGIKKIRRTLWRKVNIQLNGKIHLSLCLLIKSF